MDFIDCFNLLILLNHFNRKCIYIGCYLYAFFVEGHVLAMIGLQPRKGKHFTV